MPQLRQDRKKDDNRRPSGLFSICDARALGWWLVIPLSIILVLLVGTWHLIAG